MGAAPEFFARIEPRIAYYRGAGDVTSMDWYLDLWWDCATRATAWDARGWGLEPAVDDPVWEQPFDQERSLTPDEDARLLAWVG